MIYKKREPRSEETKRKISKALKGRKLSKEHREKMKKNRVGMLGKYHREETKKKISNTQKGKHHSKETKKKMSMSHKGMYSTSYYQKIGAMSKIPNGRYPKSHYRKMGIISVIKQQNSKGPTSIEKKLYDELKRRGLLFEKQKLINGRFLVDAYIPSFNLIIEADGNYWHNLDRVKKKDKSENAYLKTCGYNLLRLTETEINNGKFKKKLLGVNNAH